ncbi:hypothetical protein OIDMADRAFT_46672 [Oidiodendron maius Zn]|uniref:Uncharacterized protein n=1 Tax=Oidiodendron maius (strain Zn) TaxID=913774 RepID=A0A0C3HET8_OIDMZ|nr:hypothetical protein OIDMADRAFT_46672 [Oidiodendron maius Zn]
MHLSSGFLFSSLSIWGYRTSFYQKDGPTAINYFGKFGTHCRLTLATAISLYGAWFWWKGLANGLITAEDARCQRLFTWFFKQWPASGGIHTFYLIASIACTVYYGIMCVAAVPALIFKLFKVGWKGKMKFQTGFTIRELLIVYNVLRLFNLFYIIFCASMIELTLNKNHILNTLAPYGDIAHPAQLIPLVVGILSLVRVLWLIYREWKDSPSEDTTRSARQTYQYFFENLWLPSKLDETVFAQSAGHHTPSTVRLWLYRYVVAYLPWLSTLDH